MSEIRIQVRLSLHEDERLITRSQAKRLLLKIEKFKTAIFDFDQVETVGPSFADEIFRVFKNHHPDIKLIPLNANEDVRKMISRAGTQD